MLKRFAVLLLLLALTFPVLAETASSAGTSFILFRLPFRTLFSAGQPSPISDLLILYVRSENADVSAFNVTIRYEHEGQLYSGQASAPVTSPSGLANIELPVPNANVTIKSVLIEELKAIKSHEFLDFH